MLDVLDFYSKNQTSEKLEDTSHVFFGDLLLDAYAESKGKNLASDLLMLSETISHKEINTFENNIMIPFLKDESHFKWETKLSSVDSLTKGGLKIFEFSKEMLPMSSFTLTFDLKLLAQKVAPNFVAKNVRVRMNSLNSKMRYSVRSNRSERQYRVGGAGEILGTIEDSSLIEGELLIISVSNAAPIRVKDWKLSIELECVNECPTPNIVFNSSTGALPFLLGSQVVVLMNEFASTVNLTVSDINDSQSKFLWTHINKAGEVVTSENNSFNVEFEMKGEKSVNLIVENSFGGRLFLNVVFRVPGLDPTVSDISYTCQTGGPLSVGLPISEEGLYYTGMINEILINWFYNYPKQILGSKSINSPLNISDFSTTIGNEAGNVIQLNLNLTNVCPTPGTKYTKE